LKRYFKGVQRRKSYFNKWTFFTMYKKQQIILADIQEILVETYTFSFSFMFGIYSSL
jgi:hypothetical protein